MLVTSLFPSLFVFAKIATIKNIVTEEKRRDKGGRMNRITVEKKKREEQRKEHDLEIDSFLILILTVSVKYEHVAKLERSGNL